MCCELQSDGAGPFPKDHVVKVVGPAHHTPIKHEPAQKAYRQAAGRTPITSITQLCALAHIQLVPCA